jgi:hypothetical protein
MGEDYTKIRPPEERHEDCRERPSDADLWSYCVCPPKDEHNRNMNDKRELAQRMRVARDLASASAAAQRDVEQITTRSFYRFYFKLGENEVRVTFDFTDSRTTIPIPLTSVDEFCATLKELARLAGTNTDPEEP